MNHEAENFAHDYISSDDKLFFDATIYNNELDDIDGIGVESPGSYLVPKASIEATYIYIYMDPFLEMRSDESTMSDNVELN